MRLSNIVHMLQSELDDLLAASSAVAAVDQPRPRRRGGRVPPAAAAALVAAAGAAAAPPAAPLQDDEVADLLEMVAVGERVQAPAPAFTRRSSALLAHAREQRAKQLRATQLENVVAQKRAFEVALQVVAMQSTAAVALVPSRAKALPPAVKADLVLKCCTQPVVRSAQFHNSRRAQQNALLVVSEVILSSMRQTFDTLSGTAPGTIAAYSSEHGRTTLVFAGQWDETSQKFRSLRKVGDHGERITYQALAHQVMVFSGAITVEGRVKDGISTEPFFVRSMVLCETSTNFLLEGVLRSLPFAFENVEQMTKLCASNDCFVFIVVVDRASANSLSAAWLAETISTWPRNALPWCEYCSAHGCALVKGRAGLLKEMSTALRGFTHWVKYSRNCDALMAELRVIVSMSFEVRPGSPEAGFVETGQRLVHHLFGGDSSAPLFAFDKAKQKVVPTAVKKDLDAFCRVASFAKEGPRWIHWCSVLPDSPEVERGLRVGAPCCTSRSEALNKVVAVVSTLCVARAWKQACESRWTHVTSTLRRFCLCNANGCTLIQALRSIKAHWGLSTDLVAMLAREVAADHNAFPAKNKLRLLRITQSFGKDHVVQQLAVSFITTAPLDDMLFAILGGPDHKRAKLKALLHPFDSPIVLCQAKLLALMSELSNDDGETLAEAWELLSMLGGRPDDVALRLEVRRACLQLSCGVLDIFEMRYQRSPYNLVKTRLLDVPEPAKATAVDEFFAEPLLCQPLFSRRLREMFPVQGLDVTNSVVAVGCMVGAGD